MITTIRGASDDLIELEGAIDEEFTASYDGRPTYLAFSGGLILSVTYTTEGIWRIHRVDGPPATITRCEDLPGYDGPDGAIYSDLATVDAEWVIIGSRIARGLR